MGGVSHWNLVSSSVVAIKERKRERKKTWRRKGQEEARVSVG